MKTLGFPSLLIVDEIGYLPISRTGAMLLFQLRAILPGESAQFYSGVDTRSNRRQKALSVETGPRTESRSRPGGTGNPSGVKQTRSVHHSFASSLVRNRILISRLA